MLEWRRASFGNPANWWIAGGLAMLVASVWVPFLTAERTARVEGRADQIAGLLLDATRGFPTAIAADELPIVLARFYALTLRDRVHVADLEVQAEPLPETLLTLRNKHYLFYVAESAPEPQAIASRDAGPAYEVMAWPITNLGPGHSVFFHADNAPRAYTRNLTAGYVGTDTPPVPATSHRRSGTLFEVARSYRNGDDERWIVY